MYCIVGFEKKLQMLPYSRALDIKILQIASLIVGFSVSNRLIFT